MAVVLRLGLGRERDHPGGARIHHVFPLGARLVDHGLRGLEYRVARHGRGGVSVGKDVSLDRRRSPSLILRGSWLVVERGRLGPLIVRGRHGYFRITLRGGLAWVFKDALRGYTYPGAHSSRRGGRVRRRS